MAGPTPAPGNRTRLRARRPLSLAAPLALSVACLLAAPMAQATPARLAALGAVDGIEDEALLFRWPGSAPDHAGRLSLDGRVIDAPDGWAADGAQFTGPGLSVAWRGDHGWTLGFAAHAWAADTDHVALHRDAPGASYSWLLARKAGPAHVGATWRSVWGGWSSDADARDEFGHRRDDLGLGARLDLSPGAYLDLAADARRQANRMQGPGDPAAWDAGERVSARSWSARARAFVQLREGAVLTLATERLREDFDGPVAGEVWADDAALAQDNRLSRAAATLSRLPDPDTMFAATLSWAQASADRAVIAGATALAPSAAGRMLALAIAAERRANWWLSLRGSLSIARLDVDIDGGIDAPGAREHPVDAAAGVGLHLGSWGADLAVGNAPSPATRRLLEGSGERRAWLRATLHHDF